MAVHVLTSVTPILGKANQGFGSPANSPGDPGELNLQAQRALCEIMRKYLSDPPTAASNRGVTVQDALIRIPASDDERETLSLGTEFGAHDAYRTRHLLD